MKMLTACLIALNVALLAFCWFSHTFTYSDDCEFGGDVWEYQSIAVNFAEGRGFPVFGGCAPFAEYHFGAGQGDPELLRRFYANAGVSWFRPPGFTFTLGCVYRAFGVNAVHAKRFSLALLCLDVALLMLLGYCMGGAAGMVAGLGAGALFFSRWYEWTTVIATENLQTPLLLLILILLSCWDSRRTWRGAALLGVTLGAGILCKGFFLFVLLGCAAYAALTKAKLAGVIIVACALLTTLPWALYASHRAGVPIWVATEGSQLLLDANNELSVRRGTWEPQQTGRAECFYQRAGVSDLPAPVQVALFYGSNPLRLFIGSWQKLGRAFRDAPLAHVGALGLLIALLSRGRLTLRAGAVVFVSLTACVTMTCTLYGYTRLTLPYDGVFILCGILVAARAITELFRARPLPNRPAP